MNLLNSISFWPSMCPSKHISHSKTQAHSKHRSLTVSHSHSHSLSLCRRRCLSLCRSVSASLNLSPSNTHFGWLRWQSITKVRTLSLFLATDSIKSNICYQNCIFIFPKKNLYLYYESPSHYFEVQFLVLTYHMFQLHYVFMCWF